MDRRTFLGAAAASAFWPGLSSADDGPPRYALVIGNNNYPQQVGKLSNAANDARLLAQVLRQCGFTLPDDALVIDADKRTMEARIRAHSDRVAAAGKNALGFIYYSGHGAARRGGDNYLIPIVNPDLDIRTASVWDESIGVEWLLSDALAHIEAPQVIAIDACRNELRTSERGIGGDGSLTVRGLEVVQRGENANLFLSFSAWQGQQAADGVAGANGPYAVALAHCLKEPGPILTVFDKVRREVKRLTGLHQEVMNVSRLSDEASDLQIGGGVDARLIPPLTPTLTGASPGRSVGMGDPANLALVISCDYADTAHPLPNAAADADKVSDALRASDFDVERVVNPTGQRLRSAIAAFKTRLAGHGGGAVGVVHFSGHSAGMVNRGNFLMTADAPLPTAASELARHYSLRSLVRELSTATAESIVVLVDGCRPIGLQGGVGKSLAVEVLQVVHEEDMGPVLVGFSASPGQFAVEGPAASPFADALAIEIVRPERRDLATVMRSASQRVQTATGGRMRPSYLSSAPIYFRDGRALIRGA
ncbi:MAG: caspase family protein [Hyphomonadaceae bacterium]|nr:caspase family protein [Hyphomonadaceae bacterium]